MRCSNCGQENPEGFQFCGFCTAPLGEAAAPVEERKVVTVLFVDLVGFTARSDAADPEDVRARIRPYHQRLRQEIERFGGTVEKFAGDAVMAQGRSLLGLGEPGAEPALREAQEIFARLGARPRLEETNALLERAALAAS